MGPPSPSDDKSAVECRASQSGGDVVIAQLMKIMPSCVIFQSTIQLLNVEATSVQCLLVQLRKTKQALIYNYILYSKY